MQQKEVGMNCLRALKEWWNGLLYFKLQVGGSYFYYVKTVKPIRINPIKSITIKTIKIHGRGLEACSPLG